MFVRVMTRVVYQSLAVQLREIALGHREQRCAKGSVRFKDNFLVFINKSILISMPLLF